MRLMRSSPVLAVAGLVVVLAACAPPLDTQKLEGAIKSDMAAKGFELSSVSCPTSIHLKKGMTFKCTAKDSLGTEASFDVRTVDGTGDVVWQLEGRYEDMKLTGDQLEHDISARAHGQPVDVTCPSKNILVKKGVTFSCNVKVGERSGKVVFTCTSDEPLWDVKVVEA